MPTGKTAAMKIMPDHSAVPGGQADSGGGDGVNDRNSAAGISGSCPGGQDALLKPGERLDDLQRDGLFLIQNPDYFCYGTDAVLLSWFAEVKKGETAVDLCTGSGVIPILLSAKTAGKSFTGLEIQPECADMARRSVLYNHLENRVSIVRGDVKEASVLFRPSSFDVVTVNPPYMAAESGLIGKNRALATARTEIFCTLRDVVRESSRLLRPRGRLYMVYRPFRLAELFADLAEYGCSVSRLCMVHPKPDREASMVLVCAVKDGRTEVHVEPPLVLMDPEGNETEKLKQIYGRKSGAAGRCEAGH